MTVFVEDTWSSAGKHLRASNYHPQKGTGQGNGPADMIPGSGFVTWFHSNGHFQHLRLVCVCEGRGFKNILKLKI